MKISKWLLAVLLHTLFMASAHASITKYGFDFYFTQLSPNPTGIYLESPVFGRITATFDPTLDFSTGSVDSIDLAIDGHIYAVEEVGFRVTPSEVLLGGVLSGLLGLDSFTNDFAMGYDKVSHQNTFFLFASDNSNAVYLQRDVGRGQLEIPEPTGYSLIGIGLIAFMSSRCYKTVCLTKRSFS